MMIAGQDALAAGGRRLGVFWRGARARMQPRALMRSLLAFFVVIGVVILATIITAGADYFVGDTTIYTFYMLAIVGIGFRFGTPFLLLASVLSALAYAYFFADPPQSFAIERPEVSYALLMLTAVAIATGRVARYLRTTQRNLHRTTTELREQAGELTAALRRERAAREALRNLVATMCHEFRTPLTTIDLIAQNERRAARRRGDDGSIASLESMRAEIRRVNELLTALQDGAVNRGAIQRPRMERLHIRVLVDEICDLQRISAPGRSIIATGTWPDRPIPGNALLLRQMISNLVGNAIKYSPATAPILVEARSVERSVAITVIDQGIGIPSDELPRVFESYYRASNTGAIEGTGLGLALCREIVEAHRGRITIAANAPVGTRVTVSLPMDPVVEDAAV
ncbi:MAG: ATP-binding protein [Gemmatimonas sp.]